MNKLKKLKWYDKYLGTWPAADSLFGDIPTAHVNRAIKHGGELEQELLAKLQDWKIERAEAEYDRILRVYTTAADAFPEDKDIFERLLKGMEL